MFRNLHNVGLNSFLGQKTLLPPSGLSSYFIPSTQMSWSSYYYNDVSGQPNLNLKNSLYLQNESSPYHFLFDGTDDFITTEDDPYSSDALFFIPHGEYTDWSYTSWVKGLSSSFKHVLLSAPLNDDHSYLLFEKTGGINYIKSFVGSQGDALTTSLTSTHSLVIPSFIDTSKWNQITIIQEGELINGNTYPLFVFINGNYLGKLNDAINYTANGIRIGKFESIVHEYQTGYITLTVLSSYGVKIGHLVFYNRAIKNSEDRQIFTAIQDVKNQRLYGPSYNG